MWTTVGAGQLPSMSLCYTFRLGVMVLLVVKINFNKFETDLSDEEHYQVLWQLEEGKNKN